MKMPKKKLIFISSLFWRLTVPCFFFPNERLECFLIRNFATVDSSSIYNMYIDGSTVIECCVQKVNVKKSGKIIQLPISNTYLKVMLDEFPSDYFIDYFQRF